MLFEDQRRGNVSILILPTCRHGARADPGEMCRCWEVDAMGLMIDSHLHTVETRPSYPRSLPVAFSGPKGQEG